MASMVTGPRGVPEPSVERLPIYLRALSALLERGVASVSSEELARVAGVSSAMLRKDLSWLGSYGVRGVGYDVAVLADEISGALGLSRDWPVVIVGMGNLGRALAGHAGFLARGFEIVALLDHDPRLVGEVVAGLPIRPMSDLPAIGARGLGIGVIATPGPAAQEVCDLLVAAGVRSVLNLAPRVLDVPEGVVVRTVDLATELQVLAFHAQRTGSREHAGAAL